MGDSLPDDVQKQLEQLKEWFHKQPHLPKDTDSKLLLRFLHSCYYNLEKAKSTAELFFTLRASSVDLLSNRDPFSPQIQKYLKIVNLAQYKISGNRNIWIWQLNDPGLENYDYFQDAKMFFLTTDAWLLGNQDLEESDIVIMDVKDISLKFLTKFNVSIARKLSKYQEEAMPIRIKQIHIVNAPPFIDKIYGMMKPFLKQDMTDMIHFHAPNSTTLHQYMNKEDLPEDFGGTRGSMETHMQKVLELLDSKREFFVTDNLWMADKKSKNKTESTTEVGSFRTLAID